MQDETGKMYESLACMKKVIVLITIQKTKSKWYTLCLTYSSSINRRIKLTVHSRMGDFSVVQRFFKSQCNFTIL